MNAQDPWRLNADLHCHSVVSDGTLTPETLAARAKTNGVQLWSLTDHDEISGQERAVDAARAVGLPYLTGVEISVTFAGATVHIVGLGNGLGSVRELYLDIGGISSRQWNRKGNGIARTGGDVAVPCNIDDPF